MTVRIEGERVCEHEVELLDWVRDIVTNDGDVRHLVGAARKRLGDLFEDITDGRIVLVRLGAREGPTASIEAWANAVQPGEPEGTAAEQELVRSMIEHRDERVPDDDDDAEVERPAIIGATPEEVRRRIEEGRAAAAAASNERDTLDDLPF